MSEKLWRWFAAEIGPRLPIIRITGGNIWTEPGDRLCRAEVFLFGFILALILMGSNNG